MLRPNSSAAHAVKSVRGRILRLVVIVIMATFFAIGLILLFSTRSNARDALVTDQQIELAGRAQLFNSRLSEIASQLSRIANNRDTREFARDTLINASASSIQSSQGRLLAEFITLMEEHVGEYAAIRYVTYTGSIWTEATLDTTTGLPRANDRVRLGLLREDEALLNGLAVSLGQVVLRPLSFQGNTGDPGGALTPILRFASPVSSESDIGLVPGVVQLDVYAEPLVSAFISEAGAHVSEDNPGERWFLRDNQGFAIADAGDTSTSYLAALGRGEAPALTSLLPALADADLGITESQTRDGLIFAVRPVGLGSPLDLGWTMYVTVDSNVLLARSDALSVVLFVGSLALGVAVCLAINAILTRILQPMDEISSMARQWADGRLGDWGLSDAPIVVTAPSANAESADYQDELGQLNYAFQQVNMRVRQMNDERRAQLDRYTRNLDIAARISRETATLYDLERLLNRTINLISQEYGFYHAQVFLVDDAGVNAYLAFSRGEVGRQMIEQGHKLAVGSDSVIGRVTATGQPVIVSDTQAGDAMHRFNPLLPATRSEMALPLQIGDRVIGALDVQHIEPNAFRDDEVQTFQLLADQIALAVQNARLLVQAESRVDEINVLNRQLTRQAWQPADDRSRIERMFTYDLVEIREANPHDHQAMSDAAPHVSMPITVRGEVIGALEAVEPASGTYTEAEQSILRAVAERVAIAIENARLFQETQNTLTETSDMYDLSRALNEATTQRDILRAIVTAVSPGALYAQIGLFDDAIDGRPTTLHLTTDWSPDAAPVVTAMIGIKVRLADHPILSEARPDTVTLISDTASDPRIDPVFRTALNDLGTRSLASIPFNVRGEWRGLMLIHYPQVRRFSERETRSFTALIDQAGVAIDNRILLLDNDRAFNQVERLYSASRMTNMAETPVELLEAAIASRKDGGLEYELGVLEGDPDSAGWRPLLHVLASSTNQKAEAVDRVFPIIVARISPLRRREPQVFLDADIQSVAMPNYGAPPEADDSAGFDQPAASLNGNGSGSHAADAAPSANGNGHAANGVSGFNRLDAVPPKTQTPEELELENGLNGMRQYLRYQGYRFGVLYPLFSDNAPIALLLIASREPRTLSPEDHEAYRALTGQMSTVLQNRRLLDRTAEALEETRVLYDASRALSNAVTNDEILMSVITHLPSGTFTMAFMALLNTARWDQSKAVVEVPSTWLRNEDEGISLRGITLSAEQYPAWRLLATQEVMAIDDIETDPRVEPMERVGIESLDLRSVILLPLRVANREIGVVVIGSRKAQQFTERDLRVLRSLSEQASLRMEASRLLEQTERRSRQLITSARVSQIASSILDLSFLLPRIVDLIRDSFGYDHVQVFLMNEETGDAELRASTGEPGRELLQIGHKLARGSQSVIGQVTALGQPVVALDTTDARVVHRPNPYLPNTRSELALPLLIKSRVVGALDVQSNQPNSFDDDDVAVLTTLAAQISVAIDNAQLFVDNARRADDMTFLFAVTTAAANADDPSLSLRRVAQELHDSMKALSVTIYLPQTYTDTDQTINVTMLRPVAMAGSDQPLSELAEIRLDDMRSAIAAAAEGRRPIIIGNIEDMPDYLPTRTDARSALIVPLVAGADLVGLITLESAQLNAYGQDTETLMLTMSGSLSAILQSQQLLRQLKQTNEQLLELDHLKNDFLANMSHELRTPLNSIIGFSRVILKGIDGPMTEMQEQDLTTIYNSGQHLLGLINDILDQAKIAAGKMDLHLDYFEVKAVIDGVRSIGIGLVKDKPIDILIDMAPGMPQAYGDEFRTRQVLLNLVSNAAKFTRDGAITISVYQVIDDETDRNMVRIDVTDTGIGIAEKDMSLLFEAFRQVDSSLTRTQGGTGLGLPIAKSLVEMQGGRMLVQSKVNVGSIFSVLIPIAPLPEADEDTTPPKGTAIDDTQPIPDSGRGKAKKTGLLPMLDNLPADADRVDDSAEAPAPVPPVGKYGTDENRRAPILDTNTMRRVVTVKRQLLLIEDNPEMVDQIRRVLQRQGFEIFTASISLEAEAMASGLHPTLIVMDVNFEKGNGWEILARLQGRDDTRDIPIVVASLSDEEDRALGLGAFAFLRRPFDPQELAKVVEQAEAESRTERILIIDDQPESVRLIEQMLTTQGRYRVYSAGNGAEGIAQVARRRPNLVIVDLRMPVMDGFQVIEELRENPETARIPVLVVTADTLSAEERARLNNLSVILKTEMSAPQSHQLIDGVKTHLAHDDMQPPPY